MGKKGDGSIDSPAWGPDDQAAFFQNLKRSRDKGEYLRAKADALLRAGDAARREAARELLQQAISEYPDTLMIALVYELLGDAYATDRLYGEAEAAYRGALDAYERVPLVHGYAEMKLALLITATRQVAKYDEAQALVEKEEQVFKRDRFDALAVLARIAAERGERQAAAAYARSALEIESDPEPDVPRHPGAGNVRAGEATLAELREFARS
jgi:tetratricopeptide (TPR) repeat protein